MGFRIRIRVRAHRSQGAVHIGVVDGGDQIRFCPLLKVTLMVTSEEVDIIED